MSSTNEDIIKMSSTNENTLDNFQKGGLYGWICPICGRGNSPFTSTCPCKPWIQNLDITCNPIHKTVWSTSTTGGTINEAR